MPPRQLDQAELLEREKRILEAAFEVIAEVGEAGLTLERVSQNLPYSKGTLYNHFTCKEDLIVAMCVDSMEVFEGYKKRTVAFDGGRRSRMQALSLAYLLFARLNPLRFMSVISAKSGNVIEKASEARRATLLETETRLMAWPAEHLIGPALASGECTPALPLTPEQIIFAVWSNSFGAIALLQEEASMCSMRSHMNPVREVLGSANLMLDGLNWQPLSADHDWRAEAIRALETVFADELSQLHERGIPFSVDF